MALASLTVDLTLALAKFEADSGKAAQIIARDQERMSRAALVFTQALERQAQQASRTSTEALSIKAATLDLGDSAFALIEKINGGGAAFANLGARGTAAFTAISAAAGETTAKTNTLLSTLVEKIREVNAQASSLKTQAVSQNQSGALTDDGLKVRLQQINAVRDATLKELNSEYALDSAAQKLAATEAAAAATRVAAAQKIIDQQNGLTATYRTQLAALRELRDAGNLSPAQFKQAGADLVAKQPVVAQRTEVSEADRQNEQAALDLTIKRAAATERLVATVQKLNYGKDAADIEKLRATVQAENAAEAKAADEAVALAAKRAAATERLIATVQKLNYESQAKSDEKDAAASSIASQQALALAQVGSATALVAAQTQVYTAFLIAEAAAANQAAEAEQRQAQVTQAIADATSRSQAAQREAYATKVAYIAAVNEEAAALFRTKDAQRELDAIRAGVGQQQAAQLAKFSGDREFISTIYTEISAQEKLRDEFGLTTAEILKQEAAERNLTNTTAGAITRLEALATANKAASDAAARSKTADSFVQSTNQLGATINTDGTQKSRSELLLLKAAELGVVDQTKEAIEKLALLDGKTGQLGKNVFATRNQLLTLKYTLSDVIASAASGISPLTILLQQGGQVAQVEGGLGGIFRTIVSLVTPARVAIGAFVTVVSALGYAFYEGSQQSKAFADAIRLTGGYAGVTEGQFNQLAKTIGAAGQVTTGAAREFGQALIATGQVGPQSLAAATEAAAKYGQATGQDAKAVAQDFASMGADVVKWATEHNKQLHLVSAAQLDQIRTLQENGQAADAQGIIYDALNKRFSHLDDNLGTLGKILKGTKSLWSSFWDAAFDIGRPETIEDKIKQSGDAADALNKRLKDGRSANPAFSSAPPLREDDSAERARVANLASQKTDETVELRRLKILQDNAAVNIADRAALNDRVIAGRALVDQYAKEGKSVDLYNEKLRALKQTFKEAADLGNPYSAEKQAAALKGLKDSFTDKSGQSESDAQRKANLDKDLKALQDNLASEQDELKFNQATVDAIYAASNISLEDYYDRREKITAEGVADELATQRAAQARLQQELDKGAFKDPHERTQTETQLQEAIAKTANIERDAAHASSLASAQRLAAQKALIDRVTEYRAALLQSEGDEEGAAKIRADLAIKNAKLFANQAGSLVSQEDLARQQRAIEQANALAEAQRKVGIASADAARAEDVFNTLALRGGASLVEQDAGVYAIRSKLVDQLQAFAQKTKDLADAETAAAAVAGRVADPKILQAAADAAAQYIKALDNIDPAMARLREAGKSLGSSLATDLSSVITTATSLKDLVRTLGKDIQKSLVDAFVTKPLEAKIQGSIQTFIDSDNPIAGYLKKAAGVSGGDVAAQTGAVKASTNALIALQKAADAAATSLAGRSPNAQVPTGLGGLLEKKYSGTSNDPTAGNYENEADKADSAAKLAQTYGEAAQKTAASSAVADQSLNGLISAVGRAGSAFGPLPGLLSQFAASILAAATTSSGSSGGGLGGLFGSLFSSGSGSGGATAGASSSDLASLFGAAGYGHTGGMATSLTRGSNVNLGVYNGAARYHEGGAVEGASAQPAGLQAHEVPAILMGGPRGTREEVLHARDPRHADNITPEVLSLIAAVSRGSKTFSKTIPASVIKGTTKKYHSGGIVSMDRTPAVVNRSDNKKWSDQAPSANSDKDSYANRPLIVQVQAAPNMSRDTANQQGAQIGVGLQRSLRRFT